MERVIRLITFKLRNTDFMKVVFVSVCVFFFVGFCFCLQKSSVFKLPVTDILPTSGISCLTFYSIKGEKHFKIPCGDSFYNVLVSKSAFCLCKKLPLQAYVSNSE